MQIEVTPMRLAVVAMALLFWLQPTPLSAHLANFGSWEVTRDYLGELFPAATDFKAKKDRYSDEEVAELEEVLGFSLYPEDRTPTFYIAEKNGEFLGVSLFIDPRVQPKILDGAVVTLEVGIGVGPDGAIERVRVYDYRGNLALTRDAFLGQFEGRTLDSGFTMGEKGLEPVTGEEEESQLVANAAREALLLMKKSLSTRPAGPRKSTPEKPASGCAVGAGSAPASPLLVMLLIVLGRIRCRNR